MECKGIRNGVWVCFYVGKKKGLEVAPCSLLMEGNLFKMGELLVWESRLVLGVIFSERSLCRKMVNLPQNEPQKMEEEMFSITSVCIFFFSVLEMGI